MRSVVVLGNYPRRPSQNTSTVFQLFSDTSQKNSWPVLEQPETLVQAHHCRKMCQDYKCSWMPRSTHIQKYAVHIFDQRKDGYYVMIIARIFKKEFHACEKPFDRIKAGSSMLTLTYSSYKVPKERQLWKMCVEIASNFKPILGIFRGHKRV
jgi:hypothetical protein